MAGRQPRPSLPGIRAGAAISVEHAVGVAFQDTPLVATFGGSSLRRVISRPKRHRGGGYDLIEGLSLMDKATPGGPTMRTALSGHRRALSSTATAVTILVPALLVVGFSGNCGGARDGEAKIKPGVAAGELKAAGGMAERVFKAIKTGNADDLVALLPTERDLLNFARRTMRSFPVRLPTGLAEDLRRNSSYGKARARRTSVKMSRSLRRSLPEIRKAGDQRGITWDRATLGNVHIRRTIRDEDREFKEGMKGGYLILRIKDESRELSLRCYILDDGNLDSQFFIETASAADRRLLHELSGWAWLEREPETPIEKLLPLIVRHKFEKGELQGWLNTRPTKESYSTNTWVFEPAGPDKPRRQLENASERSFMLTSFYSPAGSRTSPRMALRKPANCQFLRSPPVTDRRMSALSTTSTKLLPSTLLAVLVQRV
ncbi:MAG: hypothetical protein O6952_03255 [Planctomycetota bacterium]|nr:hypothetical protein [Planctomycetota bacterium]